MNRPLAVFAILLSTVAPALAQAIGEPLPGRSATPPKMVAPTPHRASRPCPEYGPGFVRLEGSSACVRVGGSVRLQYGTQSRNGSSAAGAAVGLETRSETSFGSVRGVISGHVARDRDGQLFR